MSAAFFTAGRDDLLSALGESFTFGGVAFTGMRAGGAMYDEPDRRHEVDQSRLWVIECNPEATAFAPAIPVEGDEIIDGAATRYRVNQAWKNRDWLVLQVIEIEEVPE